MTMRGATVTQNSNICKVNVQDLELIQIVFLDDQNSLPNYLRIELKSKMYVNTAADVGTTHVPQLNSAKTTFGPGPQANLLFTHHFAEFFIIPPSKHFYSHSRLCR